ncbi:MAG: isoprenoid biosynthesis glyoxalase ElbB [Gammaproteobacteria bacterium]|nr:isoprenoid biosynthesis glyoxalase ElbB [Gammaproteobacteria bacterium]
MSKKVAVVLSGCGVYDGAEIYEATLVQLRLDEAGVEFQCMAPNTEQMHVVNHLTGKDMPEKRNVMVEAGRLCRGKIIDMATANPNDYAAVIFPGGFGAAKNLCNFATAPNPNDFRVFAEPARFTKAMHAQKKPIGLICIAPVMAPALFGDGAICTIGNDDDPAANFIRASGGIHKACAVDGIVIDEANKVISTPAYMLATRISEASAGITKLVNEVIKRM